uniref:tryptophan halogenase family protein n=1 Tax=Ningiella ruwaisensis TaxID=2364274 RepID=UPI0010A00C35|nr:tryptophan halogenase family protein [Ningiella ruwaisensis]
MQDNKNMRIVIVGGGSAGWMTAAALSHILPNANHHLTLVESSAIGTVSVGEATIPGIREFNQMLGIDEAEFLGFTKGTFKLGIAFHDWYQKGQRYMHPFGPYGVNMQGVPFHHYWLKDKIKGHETPIQDFCLEYTAALNNKFCHPQRQSRSALANLKYAYHFDALLYAEFLKKFATGHGVNHIEADVKLVHQHNNGSISSVSLSNGQQINGDLFIDCSGFKGLLIAKTLGVEFDDWREYLPCDSAIAQPSESLLHLAPYTISRAHEHGWQWQIPLQHRMGNGFVYSSDFLPKDIAVAKLAKRLPSKALEQARQLKWTNGKRKMAWKANCVAIGLAAGFIEPLESTGLQLIQSAIMRLLALFPDKSIVDIGEGENADIRTFNRYTNEEFLAIRDFVILHYKANQRDDSEFWQYCQHMAIPDSLKAKMELYEQSGHVFRDNNELFNEISWFSVMNGQGLRPKRYHPLVENMPEEQRVKNLKSIAGAMQEAMLQMPDHGDYLKQFCKSPS